MKQYDAIIIGFGKGGKTLATDMAKRGMQVAMVERSDKMYGGTCINIGCIPTKTLVHQAKIASEKKELSFSERQLFYQQAINIKEKVTNLLRDKNYHNLADKDNITIFNGNGYFIDKDVVEVQTTTEKTQLTAKHIFINTGAVTVIPNIQGVQDNPFVYTSTTIMEMTTLPAHLIIIGGGYIGLEFASMYASFGSKVTVLESYSELIGREDRDIAEAVKGALEKKGIRFVFNAKVLSVEQEEGQALISYNDKEGKLISEKAQAVLLATGRRANTEELNLDKAGVKTNERGAVVVDEYLRTSNPNIFALGDVNGGLQFTYISLDDYRIVRDYLFGDKEKTLHTRGPVAYSVFIDPPLSRVGLSETEAIKQGLDFSVKKLPVAAIPRAKTLGETDGLLKAIIDNKTQQILGCTLFAPESSEVINIITVAMKTGQTVSFLRDFIFTHPSMSEALNDLFA